MTSHYENGILIFLSSCIHAYIIGRKLESSSVEGIFKTFSLSIGIERIHTAEVSLFFENAHNTAVVSHKRKQKKLRVTRIMTELGQYVRIAIEIQADGMETMRELNGSEHDNAAKDQPFSQMVFKAPKYSKQSPIGTLNRLDRHFLFSSMLENTKQKVKNKGKSTELYELFIQNEKFFFVQKRILCQKPTRK